MHSKLAQFCSIRGEIILESTDVVYKKASPRASQKTDVFLNVLFLQNLAE